MRQTCVVGRNDADCTVQSGVHEETVERCWLEGQAAAEDTQSYSLAGEQSP